MPRRYTQRIAVRRRPAKDRDAVGHPQAKPVLVAERMAKVEEVRAGETEEANQVVGSVTWKITVRADSETTTIRPKDFVEWNPSRYPQSDNELRQLEIERVIPRGYRRQEIEMLATEVFE